MERRKATRVTPEGAILVRLLAPGRLETGTLVDLNNAGAFVATDLVLEKGAKLHVELDVPGGAAVPLEAVVARCSGEVKGTTKVVPPGLGLVFVGNTPEERLLIQRVVMSTLTLDLLSFNYEQQMRDRDTSKTRPV